MEELERCTIELKPRDTNYLDMKEDANGVWVYDPPKTDSLGFEEGQNYKVKFYLIFDGKNHVLEDLEVWKVLKKRTVIEEKEEENEIF